MGMYLPISLILITAIGAFIGHFWDRRADKTTRPEFMKRSGVLLATGLIVGESLAGLATTGLVGLFGENPLVIVGDGFAPIAQGVALVALVAFAWYAYRWTRVEAEKVA
jgi:hypothetical protein